MSAERDFPDIPISQLLRPRRQTSPVVLNSPHSGRRYPDAFLAQSRLSSQSIRKSEDFYVDELFAGAVELGAPMLLANFPRAYLDVNREPFELDPRMYIETLPSHANTQSARVVSGLGTLPRIVSDGMEIYRHRLPYAEAVGRIETIYRPYHRSLRQLLLETRSLFARAILLDCHSMPGNIRVGERGQRPDFVIGDRFGTSASSRICELALVLLRSQGFIVALNKPYAGGFITEHYGKPASGFHALQIEVNRGLYVDEQTCGKTRGFDRLRHSITRFLADFVAEMADESAGIAIAAE